MNKLIRNRFYYSCGNTGSNNPLRNTYIPPTKTVCTVGTGNNKNTINNLNKVLGVLEVPPEKLEIIKIEPVINDEEETNIEYIRLAEIVNGRCASLGVILGRIKYVLTGESMYTQLTTDVDTNFFYFFLIFPIITSITLMTIDNLVNPINDDHKFKNEIEDFFHKFNMLIWLVNVPIVLFYILQ